MAPGGNPVVAYGSPPTGNRQIYLARRNPGWASEAVIGIGGPATQLGSSAAAIHLLAGNNARRGGDPWTAAPYAHTAAGGGWETHTIANSMIGLHSLALDAQGAR